MTDTVLLDKTLNKVNAIIDSFNNGAAIDVEYSVTGKVTRIIGMTIEVVGVNASIGDRCHIVNRGSTIKAEVVGFSSGVTYLMPIEDTSGISPGADVYHVENFNPVPVGESLLGRVIDSEGRPLDGKGPLNNSEFRPFESAPINPILRNRIQTPLDVGVRSINALLSIGRGQRIGLFAGSGVGKSVLLGMMTRNTNADITVVALIGERGREVKDFIESILDEESRKNAIVVACPADTTPLMRLHGAMLATTIAEYFRDQGKQVLLLMDSLTRYAQAQREIGLAVGEPPATKGYTPSVFAKLPRLVERAGTSSVSNGSITAFYTVLAEGDDQQDPIADAARAILDGHIVLSRSIADEGCYPAIDIESSVSRLMSEVLPAEIQPYVRKFKELYSTYQKNKDLISVGAYSPGNDIRLDEAVALYPRLRNFLQQDTAESVSIEDSISQLSAMFKKPEGDQA